MQPMNKIHKMNKILALILIFILRKITISRRCHVQDIPETGKSFFQNPTELGDLINKGNFIHKYLPKQTDIDKILEVIQRKVLKSTHLPVEVKEIQAGYLCTPYFKDLYL